MLYFIFLFITGTIIGSFLNVCIYRLPRGGSVISPASHCPKCKHKLQGIDLIPILGYFIRRGRCRFCQAAISLRYPVVEALTGFLFLSTAIVFPLGTHSLEFFFYLVFLSLLVVIIFTDLEEQVIPDSISFLGIAAGLVFNFLKGGLQVQGFTIHPFLSALLGGVLGYFIFFLISRAGAFVLKKQAMGEGDLFLAVFLGSYLGWRYLLLAIFLAYLLAGAFSLLLLFLGRVKIGQAVPFGPALAVGGILSLFFGRQILAWHLNLF